jgi:hypothetical protein
MRATPAAFVGQFSEPAFHQVDPRTARGCEMENKAWVLDEPAPDGGHLVRRVVVQDQIDIEIVGNLVVDVLEKRGTPPLGDGGG